ncbi:unnamed protein product [Linum trigynum]|uniref:Uncharacterized protein n=1 Tax=Linum trigynum TaxID=586398 RepID=A0AAV2EDQ9_9ROSI
MGRGEWGPRAFPGDGKTFKSSLFAALALGLGGRVFYVGQGPLLFFFSCLFKLFGNTCRKSYWVMMMGSKLTESILYSGIRSLYTSLTHRPAFPFLLLLQCAVATVNYRRPWI